MNFRNLLLTSTCLLASVASVAHANTIDMQTGVVLTTADHTQLDRLARTGVPSDWSAQKAYPNTLSSTQTTPAAMAAAAALVYYYRTYTYAANFFTKNPYVEVTTYSPNNDASYFFSAYLDSYNPANKAQNYLGDAGFSGNYQLFTGGEFEVIVPTGHKLVLVINTGGAGTAGLTGQPVNFQVDAYRDVLFDSATPEPSSIITLGTGLIAVAGAARRRFRRVA